MSLRFWLVMLAAWAVWFLQPVRAQDKVKIGPDGVEIDSGGNKLRVNSFGAEIEDTDGTKVKVKTPEVEVEGDAGGDDEEENDADATIVEPDVKGLKKQAAIVCQGNMDREYSHVHITGAKDGVLVQGNCDITLSDSRIDVDRYGVNIQGNGSVKLIRCWVRGKKGALVIMGNGEVIAKGSTLIGGIKKIGNGEFKQEGKNVLRAR